jgi:predicted nucleic acid-binding protein
MILLDTNYLIRLLVPGSAEAMRVASWFAEIELCTSSIAWYEFTSGPIDEEGVLVASALLRDRILPFTADQACEASRLWNGTGRSRQLRIDAMIAAAAIISNADLATANIEDFLPFRPLGLRLVEG